MINTRTIVSRSLATCEQVQSTYRVNGPSGLDLLAPVPGTSWNSIFTPLALRPRLGPSRPTAAAGDVLSPPPSTEGEPAADPGRSLG